MAGITGFYKIVGSVKEWQVKEQIRSAWEMMCEHLRRADCGKRDCRADDGASDSDAEKRDEEGGVDGYAVFVELAKVV